MTTKTCTKCKEEKPVEKFWFSTPKQYRTAMCDDCRRAAGRRARNANLKAYRKRGSEWVARNAEHVRSYKAQWYKDNRDKHRAYMRQYRLDPRKRERQRELERERDHQLRQRVMRAYGGAVCNCCGESQAGFLTIDHINNDGAAHRKAIGEKRGGRKFYQWLVKNGYPGGFQVLCMNCNWGKHRNGGVCPHRSSEGSEAIPSGSTVEVVSSATGSARHPYPCFAGMGEDEDMVRSAQRCAAAERRVVS